MGKRKYTKEFKEKAVSLVIEDGLSVSVVGEKLSIPEPTLFKWVAQKRDWGDEAFVGSGHQRGEDSEIFRLRKELERARMENEILKKAAAYFAKHPDGGRSSRKGNS